MLAQLPARCCCRAPSSEGASSQFEPESIARCIRKGHLQFPLPDRGSPIHRSQPLPAKLRESRVESTQDPREHPAISRGSLSSGQPCRSPFGSPWLVDARRAGVIPGRVLTTLMTHDPIACDRPESLSCHKSLASELQSPMPSSATLSGVCVCVCVCGCVFLLLCLCCLDSRLKVSGKTRRFANFQQEGTRADLLILTKRSYGKSADALEDAQVCTCKDGRPNPYPQSCCVAVANTVSPCKTFVSQSLASLEDTC